MFMNMSVPFLHVQLKVQLHENAMSKFIIPFQKQHNYSSTSNYCLVHDLNRAIAAKRSNDLRTGWKIKLKIEKAGVFC